MSASVDPHDGDGDDEAPPSMLPGASQFFPGAAFLLILLSMFTAFIVNRSMWATQFCPSGDDFFVQHEATTCTRTIRASPRDLDLDSSPTVVGNAMP